jgi:hypothetical protein
MSEIADEKLVDLAVGLNRDTELKRALHRSPKQRGRLHDVETDMGAAHDPTDGKPFRSDEIHDARSTVVFPPWNLAYDPDQGREAALDGILAARSIFRLREGSRRTPRLSGWLPSARPAA